MSRIDQAWRRASRSVEANAPVDHPEHGDEAVLQYPRESAVHAPVDAPDTVARSKILTRPSEPRWLGPLNRAVDHRLIVNQQIGSAAIEQYQRLAAELRELHLERRLKTLLITSALPGEGKTLTAANLGLTFSDWRDQRVLLIDADVRRPSIHRLFQLPNKTGLSDVLQSEGGDIPLSRVSAALSVLTAGRPDSNTVAALTSDRMQDLVEQFAAQFDWVLVDTADAGSVRDIQLLARITGAVLFVIRAESTSRAAVQRAISELGPDFIVGTVLNRVAGGHVPGEPRQRGTGAARHDLHRRPAVTFASDQEQS